MPPKPSEAEIRESVVRIVAGFISRNPATIRDEQKLREDLNFDDVGLGFLAISLRGYVQFHNPSSTILAKEVRQRDLTIKKLVDLVSSRI